MRERLILKVNTTANALHKLTVEKVCAEYQSAAVHELIEKGVLTETETEV